MVARQHHIKHWMGAIFLPWSRANLSALTVACAEVSVEMTNGFEMAQSSLKTSLKYADINKDV